MPEKKVLIIAYYFPPMGMGGVQRVTKFVKYLPQFGWHPVVLTVKDVEYLSQDPSLLHDIPKNVRIIRSGSLDPLRILFLIKKILKAKNKKSDRRSEFCAVRKSRFLSLLLFPDNKIGWLPWALAKGFVLCKREKIDLIFSTSPPVTSHLLACLLKLLTGVSWVSDYRDFWGGYQYENLPTPFHHWLKHKMHKALLRKSDGVVAVNDMISQKLKDEETEIKRLITITHGFDPDDFQPMRETQFDFLKIVYMGTFSSDCHPGSFFAALSDLLKENLIPKNKIRFLHIGLSVGIDMDNLLTKYGLQHVVEKKGYVPHREAVNFLNSAHLFLLVITPSQQRELIITGKIFEYMAARRPILGIVPPAGAAALIINRSNAGKVASPDNISEIKEVLFYFYKKFEERKIDSMAKDLKIFERKHLTSRLAKLFEEIL